MQGHPVGFELTIRREMVLHPHASPMVKLTFPLSSIFLHDLSVKEMKRLTKLGWDLPRTVHLGMPYFGAYPPAYEPTYSMLGLIIIPKKGVYFRCVTWNADFLRIAHDISVEESIHHEKLHIIKDVEPMFKRAIPLEREHRLELRREIKSASVSCVIAKYGEKAENILVADAMRRYREQDKGKTILGNLLGFWLRQYFLKNFNKYKKYSIDLTPELKSTEVFESIELSDLATKKMYEEQFGYRIGRKT